MSGNDGRRLLIDLAARIAGELAEFSAPHSADLSSERAATTQSVLHPDESVLLQYDSRIVDDDLRAATRTRFVSKHYADAVEAGVKALNECVRKRSGRTEDGDQLMTAVFSPNGPILRINKARSRNDESAQRGHMYLCQGVIGAWRNPRAHTLVSDSPGRALMMLETINDLMQVTKSATRTRRKKN